jgi:competence protein ComFC
LENPREFYYTGEQGIEAILIDDIITTGVTLQEAQQELERHGVEVLFAVTLADARE